MASFDCDFLTVATVSYAQQALATLRSARRCGSYAAHHLFALDAAPEAVVGLREGLGDEASWISVFGPGDLGPERERYTQAFTYFNPIEMSCLAKYVGIGHILRTSATAEICIYADADILFFGDIRPDLKALGDKAVLLTQHQFGPSDDASEHGYLLHGWFNAGFLAFRRAHPGTSDILDWLMSRIERRGFLAPQAVLSCDQTWVSLLPFVFDGLTVSSRNPGLNVGYWNLESRKLARQEELFFTGAVPLVFFHFSGFDAANRGRLSKHADVPVPYGTALESLCSVYRRELDAAARMRQVVAGLPIVACAAGTLEERMDRASALFGFDLRVPSERFGVFSKIGRRLDRLFF